MMEGNINNVTFYTLTKLQGSQTQSGSLGGSGEFYTLTKLQGSQTKQDIDGLFKGFYTLTKLQGSQTYYYHI